MSVTRTLGALLLGGAVGVTLGVLYAPDKGSNTRKNIIGKKDELLDEAESKIEEGKAYVKDKFQAGKDYGKNKYQEGKEKMSDLNVKGRDGMKSDAGGKTKFKQPGGYSPSGL